MKNYLIITSSGGGGLLQAAYSEKQKILKKNPEANIVTKDLMMQLVKFPFGYFGVGTWNTAQKRSIPIFQKFFQMGIGIANKLFFPQVFIKTLNIMFKEDIDHVIDTQCMASFAIIKAVRLFNKISKKNVLVKKVIVDLATKKSIHFFSGIKKLSRKDKEILTVCSVEPLLENFKTDKEFWLSFCNIELDKISYDYPIREAFIEFKKKEFKDDSFLINFENDEEFKVIDNILKKTNTGFHKNQNHIKIFLTNDTFIITVLLGSQPAYKATLLYVHNLIEIINEKKIDRNISIFVYCGAYRLGLFKKLERSIENIEIPKNLKIIPFSFQGEWNIAALFSNSDLTVTRSGGQTAIELSKLKPKKISVHSDFRSENSNELTVENLLKGIPVWESGNAMYMKEKMNAELINVDIYKKLICDLVINK